MKNARAKNVAFPNRKVVFLSKKWRNLQIWGENFVNLQTFN